MFSKKKCCELEENNNFRIFFLCPHSRVFELLNLGIINHLLSTVFIFFFGKEPTYAWEHLSTFQGWEDHLAKIPTAIYERKDRVQGFTFISHRIVFRVFVNFAKYPFFDPSKHKSLLFFCLSQKFIF